MNKAYKQFLKDSLTDYCMSNGIDVDEIIEQVEFRASHPITVTDESGNARTIGEPDAYTYAEADGTYIVSWLDRESIYNEGLDVDALEKDYPEAVPNILSNWCDECCHEFNEASCDIISWNDNLRAACEDADVDYDSYDMY